jgi:homoserine kinase type II
MPTEFVYLLWHIDRFEDEKLIGVYRTQEDADAATERLKGMPGFRDEGGKFVCRKYKVNQDHWKEGFYRPEE